MRALSTPALVALAVIVVAIVFGGYGLEFITQHFQLSLEPPKNVPSPYKGDESKDNWSSPENTPDPSNSDNPISPNPSNSPPIDDEPPGNGEFVRDNESPKPIPPRANTDLVARVIQIADTKENADLNWWTNVCLSAYTVFEEEMIRLGRSIDDITKLEVRPSDFDDFGDNSEERYLNTIVRGVARQLEKDFPERGDARTFTDAIADSCPRYFENMNN